MPTKNELINMGLREATIDKPLSEEEVASLRKFLRDRGVSTREEYECVKTFDRLIAENAQLKAENVCDACAGSGSPVSGTPCMCGGSGKASDAVQHLRTRINGLEAEVDLARKAQEE